MLFLRFFIFLFALTFASASYAKEDDLLSEDFWKTAKKQDVINAIQDNEKLNLTNKDGYTPLMLAAFYSPISDTLIPIMTKAGADINKKGKNQFR